MTEWEVVGVIVALVGLGAAVITPIIKLNTTLTTLTQLVSKVGQDLSDVTERNSKTHARIFDALEAEDAKINDHEIRITVLEHDKSEGGRA